MATGNFVQALAIQLPDLGLAFGTVGAAAGLLAGIALPAVMAAFGGTQKQGDALKGALEAVTSAISATDEMAKNASAGLFTLGTQYGTLTEDIAALMEAQRQSGMREMTDAVTALNQELSAMYNGNAWLNTSRAEALSAGLDMSTVSARQFAAMMTELGQADTLGRQLEIVTWMREEFMRIAGPVEDMTTAQRDFLAYLIDSEDAARRTQARIAELSGTTAKVGEAFRAARDAIYEAGAAVDDLTGRIGNAIGAAITFAEKWAAARAAQMQTPFTAPGAGGEVVDRGQLNANMAGRGLPSAGTDNYSFDMGAYTKANRTKGGGKGSGADDTEKELEALREKFATEAELVQIEYDKQVEQLRAFRDAKKITDEEYNSLEEKMAKDHHDKLQSIEQTAFSAKLDAYSGALGDVASLMDSNNKKMFAVGKAASVAQATVNGYQAAVAAWKSGMEVGGPVTAAAFTAASLLKTGALISSIASTSYGGGGSGGRGGGGSGRAGATAAAAPQTQSVANITLVGDTFSRDSISDLFKQINEGLKSGRTINLVNA
jgi:hypothetical protein